MNAEEVPSVVRGSIDDVEAIELDGATTWNAYGIPAGSLVAVRGWATDVEAPESVESIVLCVDNGSPIEAKYGLDRPDVAQALGSDAYGSVGFRAVFSTTRLTPGTHAFRTYVRDRAGHLRLVGQPWPFSINGDLAALALDLPAQGSDAVCVDSVTVDGLEARSPVIMNPLGIMVIEGWAIDEGGAAPARAVFAVIDGVAVRGVYGLSREDVARARGDWQLESSGFRIQIPGDMIPASPTSIAIRAISADGTLCYESLQTVTASVEEHDTLIETAAFRQTTGKIDEIAVVGEDGHMTAATSPVRLRRGESVYLRGWAIDDVMSGLGSGIQARVDGLFAGVGSYFLGRPDVAASLGIPDVAMCGFVVRVRSDGLLDGPHDVQCCLVSADGRRMYDISDPIAVFVEGD